MLKIQYFRHALALQANLVIYLFNYHDFNCLDKTFPFNLLCFQPDCLDDLAYAIMYNTTKLAYQVSEDDVTRARNQVGFYFDLMISCLNN